MTPAATELDRVNAAVLQVGEEMRAFFTAEKRDQLRSVLFDVPRRSMLGWNCIYLHGPELIRELRGHVTPEELASRMRSLGIRPYQLQVALLFLGYLGGRQQRILDLGIAEGEPLPDEDTESAIEFLDFSERLARSYRGDGTLTPGEAGAQTRVLDADALEEVRALLEPAREDRFAPMQRCLATLEMYAFMLHGEQRDGVFGHGPYELEGTSRLFLREVNDLQNDYLPWASTEARNPFANVVCAYEADDVKLSCDVFGTLTVDSPDLERRLRASAALTRDGGDLRRLGEDELEAAQAAAAAAIREMYKQFAGWSERYKLEYGGPLFANHMKTLFDLAGVDDGIGGRLMESFESIANETGAALLEAEVPTVWQHMVRGEGPCFYPIVA